MKVSRRLVTLAGVKLDLWRRGRGKPLVLLPSEEMGELEAEFVDELACRFEVFIPHPPGFGRSSRAEWITCVDDVAYLYRELVDKLGLKKTPLLGFSLGGWIAAEMATKDDSWISRLVLVDPYGVKLGSASDREIADIWSLAPDQVAALTWFDRTRGRPDYGAMADDQLAAIAKNRESFIRLCWDPYLHNPKLKHRLGQIRVPTLLVWGENDGIVSTGYGEKYCSLIRGARMKIIPKAGHLPHLERPQEFLRHVQKFLS